jgi:site-specific DNA-methyltransferase (adenine-specific)
MATLLLGDCLELMKNLPDKSVDIFVCDLPYGCLTNKPHADGTEGKSKGGKNFTATTGCAWDVPIDLTQFWTQVKRLCKDDHTPVLMFCSTKFGFELYNSNPDWFRYDLVWNKSRGVSFLSANKMPLRSHEMIYVFAKKGATYYRKDIEGDFPAYVGSHSAAKVYNLPKPDKEGYKKVDSGKRCVKSVVSINNESNKGGKHPTQKPEDLYEWLITRYSKPGDTVLDPTAGSFASVFTAQRLGRKGIGMERDKAFYDKAVEKGKEGQ